MACKDRERKGRELRWHYLIDSGQTHQHGAEEISVKVGGKQQKRTEMMRKPENERAGGAGAKLVHIKRASERDL